MRTATWWPGGEGRRPSLPVSVDVHSVLRRCLAVKRRVDHRRVSGLEVVCTPVSSVPLRTTSDTRCTSAMTEPSSVTSRSSAKISCLCNRLRLQVWNFARTCTLTTSRSLLNIGHSIGQRSRSYRFFVWLMQQAMRTCGTTENAGVENVAPECMLSCLCLCLSRVK